jgi:hypothetical protein
MHTAKPTVTQSHSDPCWLQKFLLVMVCTFLLGLTGSSVAISQGTEPDPHGSTEGLMREEDGGNVYLPLVSLGLATSHAGRFETYLGSATCRECHAAQVSEVHGSVHYQWNGPTPAVVGMETGGKLGGINDFCGYPDINFIGQLTNLDGQTVDGGCATCHVGLGEKPESTVSETQLNNIDCLVCHSDDYRRKVEAADDGFHFVPAPERMTVSLIQAVTDIALPSSQSCLTCHAYAGGGNNNKRGDLEAAHADPPSADFDVHMASPEKGGAGLACLDCHISEDHRIAGRGVDLRPTDLSEPVQCSNCHPVRPHDSSELNQHTARVDCATCHIPAFAKEQSTEIFRDYRFAEIDEGKRLYEPKLERAADVTPVYRFFNGLSAFYAFGEPFERGANGRVTMAEPLGDIQDAGAKIQPFKYHTALLPYDQSTDAIIPVKLGVLFQTGNPDSAIRQGAAAVNWPLADGYDFVEAERYMGLYHEVAPADNALRCDSCHGGGSTRLDFAALGYTPKTERDGKPLCQSCHEEEDPDEMEVDHATPQDDEPEDGFYELHHEHVDEENITCSECHTFGAAQSE